jgi:hypothetical protein
MRAQLRSELLKQRSTQTALLLFLAMAGLVALAVALHVLTLGTARLATNAHQLQVFQIGTRAGMLFAALAGALAITAEIRFGTIRPTFLAQPRRDRVLAAKLAVGALTGLVYGLLAEGLMAAFAAIAFSIRGIPNELTGGDYLRILLGGATAAALWAVLGVGIGALVRNQVATLVGLCAWMFLVESVSEGFVPGAAKLMPGGAGLSLAGNEHNLSIGVAAILLIAYTATKSTSARGHRPRGLRKSIEVRPPRLRSDGPGAPYQRGEANPARPWPLRDRRHRHCTTARPLPLSPLAPRHNTPARRRRTRARADLGRTS